MVQWPASKSAAFSTAWLKDAVKGMRLCSVKRSEWIVAMGGGGILTYALHHGHGHQRKPESGRAFPGMTMGTPADFGRCPRWSILCGSFSLLERPARSGAQSEADGSEYQKLNPTARTITGEVFQRFGQSALIGTLYPLMMARRWSLESRVAGVYCAELRECWTPPKDALLSDTALSREGVPREVRRIAPSVVTPKAERYSETANRKPHSPTLQAGVGPTPHSAESASLTSVAAPKCLTNKTSSEGEPLEVDTTQDSIAFPYESGAGLTVRMFDKQKRSMWQIICGLLSVGFYGSIWVMMVLGPCLVACWLFREVRYRVFNRGNGFGTPTTDINLFVKLIVNGIVSILGDAPRAVAVFLKSQTIGQPDAREKLVQEALLGLEEGYHKLRNSLVDWIVNTSCIGHFCIMYLSLLSLREVFQIFSFGFSRLHRFPAIPQTNEEALLSSMSFPERCLMRILQPFHNWFYPGSAIIFEDYCQFLASGRRHEPAPLLCVHPHGVICYSTLMLSMLPEMRGFQLLVAPAVRVLTPMLNFYPIGNITLECASWRHMRKAMEKRTPLILYPGGIQEAVLTEFGKEKVYLSKRRGFIKLALQHGYRVFPVYGFGENLTYKQKIQGATEWRLSLAKRGLPIVWPTGIGGIPVLLPNRYPQLVVVGKGIDFPKIENPTMQDIAKYQDIYCQHIRRLYLTYGEKYFDFCQRAYGLRIPPPVSNLGVVDDLPTVAGLFEHMPVLDVV